MVNGSRCLCGGGTKPGLGPSTRLVWSWLGGLMTEGVLDMTFSSPRGVAGVGCAVCLRLVFMENRGTHSVWLVTPIP